MEILEADDYPRKVERAINLLRNIPQDTEIELSYSGGKEIYERDIVKDTNGKVGYITFLQQEMGFVIVRRNSDSRLGHRNRGGGYELDNSIEVIGNIHDNPELIWRKKNEQNKEIYNQC